MHHVVRLSEHSLSCIHAFDWEVLEDEGGEGERVRGPGEEKADVYQRSLSRGRKGAMSTAFEGRSQFGRWTVRDMIKIGGFVFYTHVMGYLHLWTSPLLFFSYFSFFFFSFFKI